MGKQNRKKEEKKLAESQPKNYLLMVDEMQMAFLSRVMQGVKFLQVMGMNTTAHPGQQILVTPVAVPEEEAKTEKKKNTKKKK